MTMMVLKATIGSVDMDGFLGRDAHPDRSHEGRTGWVTRSQYMIDEGVTVFWIQFEPGGDEVEFIGDELAKVWMSEEPTEDDYPDEPRDIDDDHYVEEDEPDGPGYDEGTNPGNGWRAE